jgi:hypothetical protein
MSPLLALGAGAVIAFIATRSARRSARTTELHFLTAHVTRHEDGSARPRRDPGIARSYLAEAQASLEAEMRKARGERPGSLYTPDQARAAKSAMAPRFGIRMRVKP